jgi:hypothetical protein
MLLLVRPKNVTGTDPTRKNAILMDSTHTKASKIIVSRCIAWRGILLLSNQAAVRLPASFSNPFHNCGSLFDLKMSSSKESRKNGGSPLATIRSFTHTNHPTVSCCPVTGHL